MWEIPLFDIGFNEKEMIAVQKVISSGWLTMGEQTELFEREFADFMNVKYAIAVSNGTAALHLANLSLNIGENDEVICPSLSFVAGSNSIVYTGAQPVFADITDLSDFNISPVDIEKKISARTKAIQIVHYSGNPCNMDHIMEIADKHGVYVIEDCAHAPGSEYNGRKCGAIGDVGCFSFFSNKNMTTGEGGMITTNNDGLAEKIKLMRSHGMTSMTLDRHKGRAFSYDVVELGYNYRTDEIRSAIGIAQLEKLEDSNRRHREIDQIYKERLSDVCCIKVPFNMKGDYSSRHIFPVLLDKEVSRQGFMEFLKSNGIQSSIHYPPIHLFDYYRCNFGYHEGMLPITEEVAKREVTLPLYPSMTDKDVYRVCDVIVEYFEEGK
ncbi:MAG: DegT/DnrJ/EryC1/StrS family aminotransferase [Candidatus Scalindua sp.]|jgi:dTDP-4-amino-4,6-dideoxygalactose transaminase|nr:DegT/DnrJ/EryC1/StrS family aminotransferase [Candidatus Scalindua sp.]